MLIGVSPDSDTSVFPLSPPCVVTCGAALGGGELVDGYGYGFDVTIRGIEMRHRRLDPLYVPRWAGEALIRLALSMLIASDEKRSSCESRCGVVISVASSGRTLRSVTSVYLSMFPDCL